MTRTASTPQVSPQSTDFTTIPFTPSAPSQGTLNQRRITQVNPPSNTFGPGLMVIVLIELFVTAIASLAVGFVHNSLRDGAIIGSFGVGITMLTALIIRVLHPTF